MTAIDEPSCTHGPVVERPPIPFRRDALPALVRDVELHEPLPRLERDRPAGAPYRVAHLLVRVGGRPVGWATLPFDGAWIEPATVHAAATAVATAAAAAGPAAGPPEPSSDHQVSVVIPTCGLSPELLDTVHSVLDNDLAPMEVIVVDNRPGGSAAPAALSREFGADPRVRYLTETRPGSSYARNRGLLDARGDIVAFCDDDSRTDRRWLRTLVGAFDSDPAIACVTGLIVPGELETDAQVLIEEFGGYSKGWRPQIFDLDANRVDSVLYPYAAGTFGAGANMAMRRDACVALGGFDGDLGIGVPSRGGEDLDLQVRAVLAGHRLRYEPSAIVWHAHHRSMRDLRRIVHGYGVGLVAYITKQVATSARARRDILRRIPAAVAFYFRPDSTKNAQRHNRYPRDLVVRELAGMAWGPFAYARTRWQHRDPRWRDPPRVN
jgi:GT2 family glycosyltransferase